MRTHWQCRWMERHVIVALALVVGVASSVALPAQEKHRSGQNVVPTFEGWEENPDGTFNMVFGYLNRNYEQVLDVPIGPDNNIEPDGPDGGQPTRFFPRRSRFVFRVKVPKDFGKKEIVWTLRSQGKTEKAYATLKPEYIIDNSIIEGGNTGQNAVQNTPPSIRIEGAHHQAVAGQPFTLNATVTDDGLPKAPPPGGIDTRTLKPGLRIGWYVYRGGGQIQMDPPQRQPFSRASAESVPASGRTSLTVTFQQPGDYVLRAVADDGGLFSVVDVRIAVR